MLQRLHQWLVMGLILGMAVLVQGSHASLLMAAETGKYPAVAENYPPLTFIQEGNPRELRLCDFFDYHGNACPGGTVGFMALKYGMELLYGDEIPHVDDLLIVSRSPGGPLDLYDMLFKGDNPEHRTWPPAGMKTGENNFVFFFLRKSTLDFVQISLNPGLWPSDWFELRDKHKSGDITEAEKKKRSQNRKYVIEEFPLKSFQELFGTPRVHKFIAWGMLEPGEMDRRISKQRRQAKSK
jgi:hypothetical protein